MQKKDEKKEELSMTVELYFFELRENISGKGKVVFADLDDPIDKVIRKAANLLDLRADEVAVMTPQGIPIRVYDEKGKPLKVKDIVEQYGFSFALVTKDVLGLNS